MLCLFEDNCAENFAPVSYTRHVGDLLVGAMTLRRRAALTSGMAAECLHARNYLRGIYRQKGVQVDAPKAETLFLNARAALTPWLFSQFPSGTGWALCYQDNVVAARLSAGQISALDWSADALDIKAVPGLAEHQIDNPPQTGLLYEYLWDMIEDNDRKIVQDFDQFPRQKMGVVSEAAHILYPSNVDMGAGTTVKPGVVIDAGGGPVIIGDNVEVMPGSVIIGPCYIGDNTKIKVGARIYEKTSIGPWCKVGGEVENSIILGYSNKQHDGFLGHSYLGSWVNLGADTNTSDLKNNYGTIRVMLNKRPVNTGRMFVGSLIGDHAKTSINTMLNTGTVIGVCANVFGGGFPPKAIPSFAWGGADFIKAYRLDEALSVARTVMARRKVEFTGADEDLLRYLFGKHAPSSAAEPSGPAVA